MTLPLVTIVTPSYNQARFLEQTIQSVLAQDYPRIEYLVVDGGSTDGSVDLIRKYTQSISWWVSEKDNGQAEAINKGLQRAKGEIIGWLNSDDLYLPGVIQTSVRALEEAPSASLVYGDVRAVDGAGKTINHIRYGQWSLSDLMQFQIIGQPAVFFRRRSLLEAGYLDPDYHFLLDHHLWLRIAQQGGIRHLDGEWAAARFHPQAKNTISAAAFGEEAYRILAWMKTQPGLQGELAKNSRKCLAGAHRLNAHYLLDGGQPGQALSVYGRAFMANPATALREWRRILYCFPAMLGISAPRSVYNRMRERKINQEKP